MSFLKQSKKRRLTRKSYKRLPNYDVKDKDGKLNIFIKLTRFNFFVLKYRQLLHKSYGDLKRKKSSKMHKLLFKKKKNRLYLSTYLCYLELRLSGILYNSHLIPKIRLLKQCILHGYVNVNLKNVRSYNFVIHPYDIVSLSENNITDNFFLVNKPLKKSILFKFYSTKELYYISLSRKLRYSVISNFIVKKIHKVNYFNFINYYQKTNKKKFNWILLNSLLTIF